MTRRKTSNYKVNQVTYSYADYTSATDSAIASVSLSCARAAYSNFCRFFES